MASAPPLPPASAGELGQLRSEVAFLYKELANMKTTLRKLFPHEDAFTGELAVPSAGPRFTFTAAKSAKTVKISEDGCVVTRTATGYAGVCILSRPDDQGFANSGGKSHYFEFERITKGTGTGYFIFGVCRENIKATVSDIRGQTGTWLITHKDGTWGKKQHRGDWYNYNAKFSDKSNLKPGDRVGVLVKTGKDKSCYTTIDIVRNGKIACKDAFKWKNTGSDSEDKEMVPCLMPYGKGASYRFHEGPVPAGL